MQPRAIAATIVALGIAFTFVVWMGRVSQEPIVVNTTPKGPSEDERPEVVKSGPKPKAVFEETEHDFGMMKHLTKGSHKFIVRNDGKAPLILKAGPTTCQCTIGKLGSNIVPVGESSEVELEWTIKNPMSWFEHTAEIWTNDADNTPVKLKISGFVARDLIVKPEGVWGLGGFSQLDEAKFEGWVLTNLHADMELLSATTSDQFTVKIEKLTAAEIDERHRAGAFVDDAFLTKEPPPPVVGFRVVVKPTKEVPVGQFSHNLEFTVKLNEKLGEVKQSVALTGVRTGAVDFFPLPGTGWAQGLMLVNAGDVDAAKGKTVGLLMFVRGGEEEFKVTAVEKDIPWIKVSTETKEKLGNADRIQLNIEFPPDCPKTVRTTSQPAVITLKTNHPEAPQIAIKLSFVSQ